MKHTILTSSLTTLALLLFASGVQAAPISIGNINGIYVADQLIGTSSSAACESTQTRANCDFLITGPTTPLDNAGVASIVTSNPATYLLSPDRNNAYIDLGFNGFDLYNGAGDDFVVFIVGHSTSFGFEVFDTNNQSIFTDTYNIATPIYNADPALNYLGDTVVDGDGNWLCVNGALQTCTNGTSLSAAYFDLGNSIAGNVAIGNIRIFLGEDYNGADGTRPRFSLAGGFHTQATVVPLPLPAVLFSSGLFLLGWVARRKSA